MGEQAPSEVVISGYYVWEKFKRNNDGGLEIQWEDARGIGAVHLMIQNDGKLRIDSEAMSRDFVKALLCQAVDEATFDGEPESEKEP